MQPRRYAAGPIGQGGVHVTKPFTKSYPSIGQDVVEATLDNGLKVVLLKKPGFQKKYITFATHYGGMDSVFIRPGESEPTVVPDGIAHFLEHKLFEEPDGTNVLDLYSKMGASPNAYTGTYYTVYLCSLVDEFPQALDLLLDYVQRPYFTDENVAKEQGIIEQEIQMGLDNPQRAAYYNLIEGLFHRHPARIRVIGSVESIRQITKELLYLCHDTFYHPSNMVVTVAGDVTFDEVMDIVSADMAQRAYQPRGPIVRPIPEEPGEVLEPVVETRMKVSRPYVLVGFKGRLDRRHGEASREYHRRLIAAELALQAVLGKSTAKYWNLYERGVIASRYGYSLSVYEGAAYFYAGAESEDHEAFSAEITEALVKARDEGVDPELFEEARRREVGQLLTAFDEPDWLVNLYVTHLFHGLDIFERRELLDEVDPELGREFLQAFVQERQRTVSRVVPL